MQDKATSYTSLNLQQQGQAGNLSAARPLSPEACVLPTIGARQQAFALFTGDR